MCLCILRADLPDPLGFLVLLPYFGESPSPAINASFPSPVVHAWLASTGARGEPVPAAVAGGLAAPGGFALGGSAGACPAVARGPVAVSLCQVGSTPAA